MRLSALLTLCLLVALALAAGCAEIQETLRTAADVVEEHPELIEDEEDRETWVAGAQAVKAWTGKIETDEELAMGQSLAIRAFAGFGRPHPDQALQRYVATVGKLVALQSERPGLPYSFAVVQSDRPNALALPGGFIFVSTGLLSQLGSESELACVLGHEVCHVAQKHGIEIVARDRKVSSLVDFGAKLEEEVAEYRQFIDQVYQKLTTEGYDHRYEWIADGAGARYAYHAGYDPRGLVPFLERSGAGAGAAAFEAHKTHPDPAVRLEKLRDSLATLGDYAGLPRLEERYEREVLGKLR